MNNARSIVGNWRGHRTSEPEYECVFDFASDGSVSWNGWQLGGKSFRCKGNYQLVDAVLPAVLQISQVEIVEADFSDDAQPPTVEEGLILRFYQDFTHDGGMRLEGMAVKPENQAIVHELSNRPDTIIFSRH